jgi:adenylate cyclase
MSTPVESQPDVAPVLELLGGAVAVADPASWTVRYENARFGEWFPAGAASGATLLERVPGLDAERARERVDRGRPYRFEVEIRPGPRSVSLQVDLRGETVGGEAIVLVEAQNISKQKEAEYLLDSYSRLAERQNREVEKEKERVEKLLLNIMPRRVYEELKDSGTTTPQSFESASVLLLDFAGFTDMAISRDPGALIAELNDIFTSFDRIVDHFNCERIKTIGDAYMAVAGLPEPDPEHVIHLARAALRMRRFLERRNASAAQRWFCRIGIGTGPVIGSIVGIQKFVYDIFGPAVNLAARLESLAEPMQILVTGEMANQLRGDFVVRSVGDREVRGFGTQELFSLEDEAREGR